MNKKLFLLISIIVLIAFPTTLNASNNKPTISNIDKDSEQLRLQDMLSLFLLPYIHHDVGEFYYPRYLNVQPEIEGWKISLVSTKRVNGFRGFILQIKLIVEPTIAHHVPVGMDELTYQLSIGPTVQLMSYTHLKTYNLPPDLNEFSTN